MHGESQASLQIGSTQVGTATITAYLLRSGQLGDGFATAIIAQASLRLVFGTSATPTPAPAPTPASATTSWPPAPDALVSLASVSNGCGGGEASGEPMMGDKSTYRNSNNPLGRRYVVNFRLACQLHDAGYSGAKVVDPLNGGVVDYFGWSQRQVDDKFLADMRKLCDQQVPAEATAVLADCKVTGGKTSWGAETRYNFVRSQGFRFYRGRPNLVGSWGDQAHANAPKLLISQHLRVVTMTWSLPAQPDFHGEFRGTLISRDQDSVVEGLARTTENTTTNQAEMTFAVNPATPNELVVTSGGTSEILTR